MSDRADELRGEMRYDEPMAVHNTWRAGGRARRWYRPADAHDLIRFLAGLDPGEPLLWLGLGSNLLVRDGGFPGTVIATHPGLAGLDRVEPGAIRVEAGVPCNKVARFAAKAALVGAEFLAGIPGTLGGALAMNAGAFGGSTWDLVRVVTTVDRWGRRRERQRSEYGVGYRCVVGPAQEWFLAATLHLEPGDADAAQARIRELLERRNVTQPAGEASCGSVFQNPEGDYAGRLIESAGLKGRARGGAAVSTKHANFIVNMGGASAEDIEMLMSEVVAAVEAHHGVRLVPEVRIVGEAP
jgi:UDP-N-acetylmuramate dehydrogenase